MRRALHSRGAHRTVICLISITKWSHRVGRRLLLAQVEDENVLGPF
ncbi:hypothetical protein [Rubritalea tangerina]